MSKNKGKIVACLDMGTTKTTCIIAAVNSKKISVLGYSYKKSKGIVASAISDMKQAQQLISAVVSDAEKMAGFNIDRLVVSISGSQIISQRKEVSHKISSNTVKNSDITNLAKKVGVEYKKNSREVIHLIPLQYKIDGSNYVQNPLYMTGKKISAIFHVVSIDSTTTKNIESCLKRCHLSVNNYVSEAYCSSLSLLNENEFKNTNSLIIDFGGVSTSYCFITEGKLIYTGHVNVGGMHITRDISTILNVDYEVGEQIKRLNSSLIINPIEEKELIKMKIGSFNDNFGIVRITKSELRDIMSCRIEEIVELVKKDLDKNGYGSHLFNNIVLSGGVCSIIGIEKIVNQVFDKQSKVGYPQKISDLVSEINDPSFASSVGMLVFLQNIYKKESNGSGFQSKNSLLKRFIDYLMSL